MENLKMVVSRDSMSLAQVKENIQIAEKKKSVIICRVMGLIASLLLLILNFFRFSSYGLIVGTLASLILIFSDDLRALNIYNKLKKSKKKTCVEFDTQHFIVISDSIRSEVGYNIISDITKTENGVVLTLDKIVFWLFSNSEIEKCVPVGDFIRFLEEKTGLYIKEKSHLRTNSVALKFVAVMLVVSLIIAPLTIYSIPKELSFQGCSVEMNKSYRIYDSDDTDSLLAESSLENIRVSIYNYQVDEFSDAYDCGPISEVIQGLETFAQDIEDFYDGERLERNGELVSALPSGIKVFKMRYLSDGVYIYGVFCIRKIEDRLYFVEFLKKGDFSKSQDKKIDKYISSIKINTET